MPMSGRLQPGQIGEVLPAPLDSGRKRGHEIDQEIGGDQPESLFSRRIARQHCGHWPSASLGAWASMVPITLCAIGPLPCSAASDRAWATQALKAAWSMLPSAWAPGTKCHYRVDWLQAGVKALWAFHEQRDLVRIIFVETAMPVQQPAKAFTYRFAFLVWYVGQ